MFVVFLGNTLEENKVLFLMKVPQWCVFNRLMDAATQMLVCNETINQFEVKTWFLALKECENSHTLTTIRLTIRTVFCASTGPVFTDSWSWMKSSARHKLTNNLS